VESPSDFADLVTYIVTSIVDFPEEVTVTETEERSALLIEVSVAEKDMGRLIGKGGVVINSIRTLVQIAGSKKGKRISLEIV
jgi:predicted RNA-binding protein YlqC (UPF0109 family)